MRYVKIRVVRWV